MNLEHELLNIIDEKNKELRWMRRKVAKLEEREKENEEKYRMVTNNYTLLEESNFGKKFVFPILRRFKKYKDEDLINKSEIKIIKQSKFFDAKWYLDKYPDLAGMSISLEEHYLRYGWKENRDPSPYFSTKEYLNLNSGVKYRDICPLLHYEKAGKYEGKQYRINKEDEIDAFKPTQKQIDKWTKKRNAGIEKIRKIYDGMEVESRKILFCNFQHKYTCNTKYICEKLLEMNADLDIVWLIDPSLMDYYEYPRKVRLVPFDSKRAKKELATAKIIVDNGVISFGERLAKKTEQVSICTWHGSLGFKKMGADIELLEEKEDAVEKFTYNHDILISNSTFEEEVYRTAHWPDTEIWRLGHARNDILIRQDKDKIEKLKFRFCVEHGISFDKKFILYAPTFREDMLAKASNYLSDSVKNKGVYDIDFTRLTEALQKKFGGEWVVLIRHHYVNLSNKALKRLIPEGVINVTDYTDIQELMLIADAGITDYSSWILDFIFTKKPGFLYTVDEDEFERDRGMYYPLRESPLSVAQNMDELECNIEVFEQETYEDRIQEFLESKGCIDDGHASERIAYRIIEIIS